MNHLFRFLSLLILIFLFLFRLILLVLAIKSEIPTLSGAVARYQQN